MRVISSNTDIPWLARSPDKSPLDYYLWGGCEAEVRRVKPNNMEELKEVVNDCVASLDEDEVRRDVRDARPRPSSASKSAADTSCPSSRSTRGARLRSENILCACSY